MTTQQKKDNRGYLYPNKNKNKPTQPDMTGTVIIDGKELRISAWQNKSPKGDDYLSISFSQPLPKTPQENEKENKPSNQSSYDDFDLDAILNSTDDNPF